MKKIIKNTISVLTIFIIIVGMTGCNNKKDKKVTEIKTEIISAENASHYMTVTGVNKNSKEIWNYKTDKVFVDQNDNLEYFKTRNNIVYLNVNGMIIALDKQTGKELWTNTEYRGSGSKYTIDEDNNLYLTSSFSPILFIVNEEGFTIRNIRTLNIDELSWPDNIKIEGSERIVITYPKIINEEELNFKVSFYLDDLLNIQAKILDKIVTPEFERYEIVGFEEVKKFELNSNGELYVTYKPDTELAKNNQNQKVLITDNVKNIYPVMVGSSGEGQLLIIGTDGTAKFIDSYDLSSGKIKLREYKVENVDYIYTLEMYDGINFEFIDINGKAINDFSEKRK